MLYDIMSVSGEDKTLKKCGYIIARLRKKQGLTQEQLGKKLNVSYQAVSKWENNLSEPDLDTIEKLTEIFNISITDFFYLVNNVDVLTSSSKSSGIGDVKSEQKLGIANENINGTTNSTALGTKSVQNKNKSFIKNKPWYLAIGLGILIVVFTLCFCFIPRNLSGKQIFDKYDSSIFYIYAENANSAKIGTGFFINKTGLAVTVLSNLEDCETGKTKLNNGENYSIEKIVGIDTENNLVLIQTNLKRSNPVKLGNSNKIAMGDKVYAITYTDEPLMQSAKSVLSEGIVYKTDRNSSGVSSIQTTATTEKANKGGVLFNERGEVVGIIEDKLTISGDIFDMAFDMVNVVVPSNYITSVKQNINTTLWEHVNEKLSLNFYNSNGTLIETKKVSKGFVLKDYKKTGYVVSGLYLDNLLQQEYDQEAQILENLDIYVDIRPIKYTVQFDSNGATGTMASQDFYYDQSQTLSKCTYTLQNKMFVRWLSDVGYFNDEEQILNLTTKDNEIIRLSAVWIDLTFTINFDGNGASGSMNSISYTYNQTVTVPNSNFYKEGYIFSHWECGQNVYNVGDELGYMSDTQTDFTFVAVWTPITYKIKYSGDGYSQDVGTATYDQGFTLTDYVYKNKQVDYFTFNGETYHVGDSVINLANYNTTVTLNIVWKGVDFEIRYYTDETNYVSKSYTWGEVRLASYYDFKKVGYTCNGFYSSKYNTHFDTSELITDTKYEIEPNEVLSFVVDWKPIDYIVKIGHNSLQAETINCKYGTEYTVPTSEDYKEGYTLTNYTIKINNTVIGVISVGEKFSNLTSKNNEIVYLYPNWQAIEVKYNFYCDGQLWKTDVVTFDEYYTMPNYTTEKEGMWFNGWLIGEKFFGPSDYVQVKYSNSENNFDAVWSKQLKGEGTEENPYLIENYDDLCSIKYIFDNSKFYQKTIKLVNDIDCENKLLSSIYGFHGCTFDGNNKIIKNVQFETSLFRMISNSHIKNLGIENYSINYQGDTYKDFGGLAQGCVSTTIENCYTIGKINVDLIRSKEYETISVGGLCAWANTNMIIKNCYSKTEITFNHSNPNAIKTQFTEILIAGLVANLQQNSTIENCYAITSIDSSNRSYPLVAYQFQETTISNCFYGYSGSGLKFLDNPDQLSEFTYILQIDNNTEKAESLGNLYSLEYLNSNLNFDTTIWVDKTPTFPTLKSY